MERGFFISLDGLDGAGKSTHCRLLAGWLRERGMTVTECTDPGGTEIGQILRGLLLDQRRHISLPCEALLFMASRAQLTTEVIRPALHAGQVVVCDRYLLANIVYQGYGGGLDPEQLRNVGRLATGGLEPDLTLILDLPLVDAQTRRKGEADRLESRDEAYHASVRAGFLAEADKHPKRIRVIDASRGVDEVQASIRSEVENYWRQAGTNS
jgi:dTMP kinase